MHTEQGHAHSSSLIHVYHVPLLLFIFSSLVTSVSPDIQGEKLAMVAKELNLVDCLHLHNTTFQGLQQLPGPLSSHPAAFFTGSSRAVYYSSHVRDSMMSLIKSSKEFSFLTSIRQQRHNAGTIFAFSYGRYQSRRYLEIQSSGRQDVLRIHYSPISRKMSGTSSGVRVETFPLRLADDSWHRLGVIVSGDQIEVLLDCQTVHRRVVPGIDTSFLLPTMTTISSNSNQEQGNLTAWLGQRNQDNFLFKGYLQDTKLVAGHHGYLLQCPHRDSTCPTCGQFQELQETMTRMQEYIQELNKRLMVAEKRIEELEQCDCTKSCGDRQHRDTWIDGCYTCTCDQGHITCTPISCPESECAKPDPPAPGSCCPTCRKSCSPLDSLTPALTHGQVHVPARCHTCTCHDGFVNCTKLDPTRDCPMLECPSNQRITEEGKCCPVCRELDYCSRGDNCHPMAECKNGIFNFSCHCNQGFQGNGTHCDDVDECATIGGSLGHHCTLEHGTCINLPGGYTCACETGFRMDSTNTTCLPVDKCLTNQHTCHSNATCISTGPGTYSCQCLSQFEGDGTQCQPLCEPSCDNGGTCISPDTCSCMPGYHGSNCQEDVNECELGEDVHKCGGDSVCVNRIGWFYCACRQGYHGYYNPMTQVNTCLDVDECGTGTHTCHSSATCINTQGGYSCICPEKSHSLCSTDCVLDEKHYVDGSTWTDGCNQCTCLSGQTTCQPITCDCHMANTDRGCCPQCYETLTCPHQDIPGLRYNSGHRWIYDCMECECLHGETDCWPQDCPPVSCADPVISGGCCPTCACDNDDRGDNTSVTQCSRSQGDTWYLNPMSQVSTISQHCTSCQCQVHHIHCNPGPSCSNGVGTTAAFSYSPTISPTNNQHMSKKSENEGSKGMFLEYIQIPESKHDSVTQVSSKTHHQDHLLHNQQQHYYKPRRFGHRRNSKKKSSQHNKKALPFSNELEQNFIKPSDESLSDHRKDYVDTEIHNKNFEV